MKNVVLLISVLLLFRSSVLLAQTNKRVNVWYFGYNAGLNFNTGNPTPLTDGALSIWEGCATICDENGNLLFYTDGRYIWNKNHAIMPNATNLGGDDSSSQSGVIVPQPENPNRYFVFSVDAQGGSGGIQYSIVDITLNGGLGGLISKNNRLLARTSEKLTAVRHCNNKDFWVIAHELNNSFKTYLITSNGISANSVESKVGSVHYSSTGSIGYMKASPNGQNIALGIYGNNSFEIFRFDNQSGIVSNPILLQHSDFYRAYGVEFSPNSKLLYVNGTQNRPGRIYQLDISGNNSTSILQSRIVIGEAPISHFGALQLGPDNKIYVAIDDYKYLGIIANPNSRGVSSQFISDGVYLAGKLSGLGLPNLITSYFNLAPSVTVATSKGNSCNDVTLLADVKSNAPNLVFQWFLDNKSISGANQPSFKPTRSGSYFVSVKEAGQCVNDSVKSALTNIFILEANPKILNTNCGSVQLQANANASLKWSGNGIPANKATQDTLTVYGSGTQIFKVQVVNPIDNTCSIEKEITVNFTSSAIYSFGRDDVSACDTVTLSAPVNPNWNSYVWSLPNGTTVNSSKLLARQSGRYIITVKNTTSDCEAKDEVNLIVGTTPTIKPDERLCLSTSYMVIDADATGNNLAYEWSPGNVKNSSLVVNTAGKYQVKVTSPEGCSVTRSVEVFSMPIFDLGNDITICEGNVVELKPNSSNLAANATYLWTTGATTPSISPKKSGIYILSVQQSICQATDSIKVTINPVPKIKVDETTCLEKTIEAGGLESNLIYEWQGLGETKPVIEIANEGMYKVKISNQFGCSKTRTITVDGPCNIQIFAPTAFTPNSDGVNDIFKVIVVGGEGIKLDVYNRWGNQIYSGEGVNPKWDGLYKGEVCPNGIYPYVLIYKSLKGDSTQEYRGTILLFK